MTNNNNITFICSKNGCMEETPKKKSKYELDKILFENEIYTVLDESTTHYICPPFNNNEGYHYISKDKAIVVN